MSRMHCGIMRRRSALAAVLLARVLCASAQVGLRISTYYPPPSSGGAPLCPAPAADSRTLGACSPLAFFSRWYPSTAYATVVSCANWTATLQLWPANGTNSSAAQCSGPGVTYTMPVGGCFNASDLGLGMVNATVALSCAPPTPPPTPTANPTPSPSALPSPARGTNLTVTLAVFPPPFPSTNATCNNATSPAEWAATLQSGMCTRVALADGSMALASPLGCSTSKWASNATIGLWLCAAAGSTCPARLPWTPGAGCVPGASWRLVTVPLGCATASPAAGLGPVGGIILANCSAVNASATTPSPTHTPSVSPRPAPQRGSIAFFPTGDMACTGAPVSLSPMGQTCSPVVAGSTVVYYRLLRCLGDRGLTQAFDEPGCPPGTGRNVSFGKGCTPTVSSSYRFTCAGGSNASALEEEGGADVESFAPFVPAAGEVNPAAAAPPADSATGAVGIGVFVAVAAAVVVGAAVRRRSVRRAAARAMRGDNSYTLLSSPLD